MNRFRVPEVLFGALLAVAIFALGAIFSRVPLDIQKGQPPQQKAAPDGQNTKAPDSDLAGSTWLTKDASGLFTFAAVLVASFQAGLFFYQLKLMRRSLEDTSRASVAAERAAEGTTAAVELARVNAQHQLRAYVSFDGITYSPKVDDAGQILAWTLHIGWHNAGSTPAYRFRNHLNAGIFDANGMPDDYELLNIGHDPKRPTSYISPGGKMLSHILPVDIKWLEQVANNRRIYFWGHIEYDDAFTDTPRHRLEFCDEVLLHGDPRNANCRFQFIQTRYHVGDVDPTNQQQD